MSFENPTPTDLLFANTIEGTALATFTAEASLLAGMNGMQPMLRAGYFGNLQQGTSKMLRLWARGVCGSTTTGPTFTFFVRLNTTAGAITGTSIAQTPAITMQISQTNAIWELECDMVVQTMGYGAAAATIQCGGTVTSPGFVSPFFYPATPAASASVWTATFDASVAQFISLSASCGTSNAANTVKLKQLFVFGAN